MLAKASHSPSTLYKGLANAHARYTFLSDYYLFLVVVTRLVVIMNSFPNDVNNNLVCFCLCPVTCVNLSVKLPLEDTFGST